VNCSGGIQAACSESVFEAVTMRLGCYDDGGITRAKSGADEAAQSIQQECIVCIKLNNVTGMLVARPGRN